MISYKDMTLCGFNETCEDGDGCPRAITQLVRKAAGETGLPICQFRDPPMCYKEKQQ